MKARAVTFQIKSSNHQTLNICVNRTDVNNPHLQIVQIAGDAVDCVKIPLGVHLPEISEINTLVKD